MRFLTLFSKADALLAAISTSIFEFDAGEAAKSRLTATHDKVSFIAAEVFEMISEEFSGMSAYEIGHAYGRVSFEVISIIATLPAVELTIATKVASLTKLADACKLIRGAAQTRWGNVIVRIQTWIAKIRATKMCFVAGTLVATAHGMTPIEQIHAGDLVWSKPESGSGVVELRPVIQTFVTHPDELWKLTYRSSRSGAEEETITGTAQHPFWTEEAREFVPMGDLKAGMTLLLIDGQSAKVLRVENTRGPPETAYTTYNFEVEDFHTYFVGDKGLWVHNSGRAECEKIFSIYSYMRKNRVGNGIQETPYQTFIEMLETLKSSSNPGHNQLADTAFDFAKGRFNGRAIRFALKAMNDEMYGLAASGQLSWRALPKIKEFGDVNGKFRGLGSWGRPRAGDMHKHHLLEGRYFERIKSSISSNFGLASADDLPAFIVEQPKHTGLGGIAPELTKEIGDSMNPLEIKNAHLKVYRNLGMEDARSVFLSMWNDLGLP